MPPSGQYVSNKFKLAVAFEVGQDWYLVPQEKPGLVMFETGPDSVRLERVMNLGENHIEMRITQSVWFPRDLCFPHS
jgi:hypothetical protein